MHLFKYLSSALLGTCIGVAFPGHIIILSLTFCGGTKMLSKVATPFDIPISSVQGSQSLHTLAVLYPYVLFSGLFFALFYCSHPNKWQVISHCRFDFHFRDDYVEHLSICLLVIQVAFLEKCLLKSLTHFKY